MCPWQTRSPQSSWFRKIADAAGTWAPAPSLSLNTELIRSYLKESASNCAEWLFHPCINALTLPPSAHSCSRDLVLALWGATHASQDLGNVVISIPSMVWSRDGGALLEPGTY